ncbi:MAG: hydroxymethylglutaryl-CoA reductase, degradative [Thermoplasmata archaeon]|nr:hydroxymethylglutaryl-CoA reductase, degradative [Thermoplasmata archaeon]
MKSEISGFYKMSIDERLKLVKEFANLGDADLEPVKNPASIDPKMLDRMIENVVGCMMLPMGIAVNFLINGKDYLVPMAIEEASVVAAASHGAKLARAGGGFTATTTEPVMIGQVQLTRVPDPYGAKMRILEHREEILAMANEKDPVLVKLGGGARDLNVRVLESRRGSYVVVHLLVNTRDAMGANAVNTMAEAVASFLEKITGGRVVLRILSNLAVYRLARARALFKKELLGKDDLELGGEDVVEAILDAYELAEVDPFRCATHNKGIMNGISAVAIATGNDFRALEAGAHSYAFYAHGTYKPLTKYEKDAEGNLVGTIEIPLAVGLVGGVTAVHPTAKAAIKILGVKSAQELAGIMASVGLAQNFAALRALATEGIQKGHMSLHARNIAATAGAVGEEIDLIAEKLVAERKIRVDRARELLEELRRK